MLIVDTGNLFKEIKKSYNGKLDYGAYYLYIKEMLSIGKAIAYGFYDEKSISFVKRLEQLGYVTRFKEKIPPYDSMPYIISDMLIEQFAEKETIIFGTASNYYINLYGHLMTKGHKIIVFAKNIHDDIKELLGTRAIEVPPSCLYEEN